jgi:hypothetical protein
VENHIVADACCLATLKPSGTPHLTSLLHSRDHPQISLATRFTDVRRCVRPRLRPATEGGPGPGHQRLSLATRGPLAPARGYFSRGGGKYLKAPPSSSTGCSAPSVSTGSAPTRASTTSSPATTMPSPPHSSSAQGRQHDGGRRV